MPMSTYNEIADQIHGVYHRFQITLNGNVLDDIPNNLKFNNMANDSAGLEIGTAYCSKITFEMTDPTTDIVNQEVLIEDGVRDSDGSFVWSPIGYFMATDAPTDRGVVSFTLYDRMAYKLSGQYTTSLRFPTTDKAIIEEICSRCGVTMVGTLTAHTISIMPTGTNRDVLSSMLQLQGKNAFFNAAGQLEIKWYTDSGYTVEDSQIYYDGDASVKETFSIGFIKNTRTVQKTVTKEEDQTDYDENGNEVTKKVSYTEETSETETYTAGDGLQGVSFENPYMTQDIVNELYEKLKTFSYTPAKFRIVGDFRIKAMDIVSVTTGGKTYKIPVMCVDHTCDGGLIDEIYSYGESESASTVNEGNSNSKAFARYDAELAYLKTVYANTLNVNKAYIAFAEIKDLHATNAVIKKLDAETVKTIYLEAEVAKLGYVTAGTVEAQYARLDKANIGTGWIDSAMIGEGVVGTVQIADGSITDAKIVELTANKITAGTLSVERLEIRGTANSIVYALNNITGALQAQNVDTLNGEILTPRSITADRIVAGAITAKEIASEAIRANHILAGEVKAKHLDIEDLSAISALIGGWALGDGYIRELYGGKYTGLGRNGVTQAFFAGGTKADGSDGIFRVGHDGKLYAANATISGNVTADTFKMTNGNYVFWVDETPYTMGLCIGVIEYVTDNMGGGTVPLLKCGISIDEKVSVFGEVSVFGGMYSSGTIHATGSIYSDANLEARGTNSSGSYPFVRLHIPNVNWAQICLNGGNGRVMVTEGGGQTVMKAFQCGSLYATGGTFSSNVSVSGKCTIGSTLSLNAAVYIENAHYVYVKTSAGTGYKMVGCSSSDNFHFCSGGYDESYGSTYYSGNTVYMRGKTHLYRNLSWEASSDARLKHNITELPEELLQVYMDIQPVHFLWNDNPNLGVQTGVIAQQVLEAFEKHNISNADYNIVTLSEDVETYGFQIYTVNYDFLNTITMAVVQNHEKRIKELERELERLKSMVA